MLKTEASFCIQ